MAVVPCILVLGDSSARGSRPVSELSAINPALTASQSLSRIWDHPNSRWVVLQPGANTDGGNGSTTFWGIESLLRNLLLVEYPSPKVVYFMKKTIDVSQMAPDRSAGPYWTKTEAEDDLVTALFSDLLAAQADLAGDTLAIDAICISIQNTDMDSGVWRAYGELVRSLIDRLRSSENPIAFARQPCPVVLVEPHYGYQGPSPDRVFRRVSGRMQIQQLASFADKVFVARCHQMVYVSEQLSATSIVLLADRVVKALRSPAAVVDVSSPEAGISLWIGDDTIDGKAPNSNLPSHLQTALTGAFIWSPYKGAFQTLQVGVNNTISGNTSDNLLGAGTEHGPEPYVADSLRTAQGSSYMVKGALQGALAGPNTRTLPTAIPPCYDPLLLTWSPGARGQMFDLVVRGWFLSSVDWIRNTSKKPRLDLVVISVGSNDLQSYCTPEAVADVIRELMHSVLRVAAENYLATTLTKFVVLIPSSALPASASLDALRSDFAAMAGDETVQASFIDLGLFSTLPGSISLDAVGNAALGQAIIDAFREAPSLSTAVAPLFVPSKAELRKALRMSAISADSDALKMIDAAIQTAGVLFYRSLGADRIATLRSIPYPNTPYSDLEYLRVLAASTEIKAVRAQLLRTIPLMLMDGSIAPKTWHEEAGFREGNNALLLRDELKRLDAEISSGIEQLSAMKLTPGGGVSISIVSPDSSISPGQTVQAISF